MALYTDGALSVSVYSLSIFNGTALKKEYLSTIYVTQTKKKRYPAILSVVQIPKFKIIENGNLFSSFRCKFKTAFYLMNRYTNQLYNSTGFSETIRPVTNNLLLSFRGNLVLKGHTLFVLSPF